jgi:hypothetical protein
MTDFPVLQPDDLKRREVYELANAMLERTLTAEQGRRLNELVCIDPEARRHYVRFMYDSAMLSGCGQGGGKAEAGNGKWEDVTGDAGLGMRDSGCGIIEKADFASPESRTPNPAPLPHIVVSPLSSLPSPLFSLGGLVFSYMISAVILGVAMLGAWSYKISHDYRNIVDSPLPNGKITTPPAQEYVGRITGLIDCIWAEPDTETLFGASVPMGRRYALAAGRVEITYDSGAKVLLQGPCTYNVKSFNSGFLSIGKLTARVESEEWRVESAKQQVRTYKTQVPNHKSSNLQIPQFAVRTPTAVVTDLGTEFGVEVDENGATESHVKQGKVDVEIVNPQSGGKKHLCVTEGNAVRIEPKSGKFVSVPYAAERFADLRKDKTSHEEEIYIQAVLADKPLGYWPLNEPAGARKFLDRSGNGFHGAAMGTVLAGRDGPLPGPSRAVVFNGKGYIDVGRNDRFALANNFTVEAWTWIENTSGVELGPVISAGSGESRYQQSGWCLAYRPRSQVQAGGNDQLICTLTSYSAAVALIGDIDMPTAQWVHVAYIFGADNVAQAFFNGRPSATAPDCKPAKVGPTWVSIGWSSNVGGEYWRGRLAHVAVYPRALNERQILNHYRECKVNP